jgi:hypothetical protein
MRRALPLLVASLSATPAFAIGEGETTLTVGPGLALGLEGSTRVGGLVDARFLFGLTDAWSARLGLAGSWLATPGAQDATQLVTPALGVTVAADVLNLVPFAEVGIAFGDVRGGGLAARHYLGGQLAAGVEYLATRRFTVSLLGRVDYFAIRLAGPDASPPLALVFALHLGRVFGP